MGESISYEYIKGEDWGALWWFIKWLYLKALGIIITNLEDVLGLLSDHICWRCWVGVFDTLLFHKMKVEKLLTRGKKYAISKGWVW